MSNLKSELKSDDKTLTAASDSTVVARKKTPAHLRNVVIPKEIQTLLDNTPVEILLHIDRYRHKPYSDKVIYQAFDRSCALNYDWVYFMYHELDNKPYRLEIIKKMYAHCGQFGDVGNAGHLLSTFDNNHNQPDSRRFADLKYLNVSQVYNTLLGGIDQSMYSSTYHGLMDDILHKLHTSKQSLTSVLSGQQKGYLGTFLQYAEVNNRFSDLMKVIPEKELPILAQSMGDTISGGTNVRACATLVSLLLDSKPNSSLRHALESEVKNRYLHAPNPKAQKRFGLIAAAYASGTPDISPDMKAFFLGVAHNPTFKLIQKTSMERADLVDKKGINTQLYAFPWDADGQASFANFVATYRGHAGWKVEEHKHHVMIHSTRGMVRVELYANRPGHMDLGYGEILDSLTKGDNNGKRGETVFVNRGHSYFLENNMEHEYTQMKLVVLGSCGGNDVLSLILNASPDAQIIATTRTGRMAVNDAMMLHINESINRNGRIDWNVEQKALDKLGERIPDAKNYLLPHRNMILRMINSLKHLDLMKPDMDVSLKPSDTEPVVPAAPAPLHKAVNRQQLTRG